MIKLFYFSGTGNTLKLARDLASNLEEAQMIKITNEMSFEQTDCEVAVIAYPVYCFGLPNIVSRFAEKVNFSADTRIYSLSSYGGMLTSAGKVLQKKLKQRGYELSAGFAVQMPGNATYVYDVVNEEKREKMFAKEREKIKIIAQAIKNKEKGKISTNMGLLGKMMSVMSDKMLCKINEGDKNFYVDEKCNSCNICMQVCPVGNIEIVDGKPQWLHHCEGCMACFHWCPQQAIQYGKKTSTRGRYHHPEVQVEDFINSNSGE